MATHMSEYVQNRLQTRSRRSIERRPGRGEALAKALGWFSIGLGVAEVLAPRAVARVIGIQPHPLMLPVFGMREIAAGVGILTQPKPAEWVLGRVAGDVCDLAALATAVPSSETNHARLALATVAVAGVTVLDLLCAQQLSESRSVAAHNLPETSGVRVQQSLTINRSREDVYQFWRNFENLPRFMHNLESVEMFGERRSKWVAKGPVGMQVSWEAETLEDIENELIRWQSVEGSQIATTGSIQFRPAPGNRGTEIRVLMTYDPPGGQLGAAIANLFGASAEMEIKQDLRRFKQIIETGELSTTSGQPRGRCVM
jgi:uncharacterized membrane protein